jgi:hypothetical protein
MFSALFFFFEIISVLTAEIEMFEESTVEIHFNLSSIAISPQVRTSR